MSAKPKPAGKSSKKAAPSPRYAAGTVLAPPRPKHDPVAERLRSEAAVKGAPAYAAEAIASARIDSGRAGTRRFDPKTGKPMTRRQEMALFKKGAPAKAVPEKAIKSVYRARLRRMDSIERLSPEDYAQRANTKVVGDAATPRAAKAMSVAELRKRAKKARQEFLRDWDFGGALKTEFNKAIRAAVVEERERCAKLVEKRTSSQPFEERTGRPASIDSIPSANGQELAAAIRAGGSR